MCIIINMVRQVVACFKAALKLSGSVTVIIAINMLLTWATNDRVRLLRIVSE